MSCICSPILAASCVRSSCGSSRPSKPASLDSLSTEVGVASDGVALKCTDCVRHCNFLDPASQQGSAAKFATDTLFRGREEPGRNELAAAAQRKSCARHV